MITVEFEKQAQGVSGRTQSWLLVARILSSSRTNTNKLFKLFSSNNRTYFHGVASPVDLLEMLEAPAEDGDMTYWLADEVSLLLRCEADIDEVIKLIRIDLDEFERSLKSAETTESIGVIQIG